MKKPITTKSSRVVWSCPWYSVRQDKIVTAQGTPGIFNVVQLPGAVWIVPVTAAGEVVLIHTYRHTVANWCYEVPAGGLHPGQQPLAAARAELQEEVGGTAASFDYLGQFYTMNGVGNEIGYFYLATGVTLGQPQHEPMEVIEVVPTPIPEALRMAQSGAISDVPSAMALLLCAERLRALAARL